MEENLTPQEEKQMCINEKDKTNIATSCKWAHFIAILGFIFIGLGTLACIVLFILAAIGNLESHYVFLGLMCLITFFISLFPNLYLYIYASRGLKAVENEDSESMSVSLLNLKSYFKFSGIITIIALSLYLLGLAIALPMGLLN